MSAPAYQLIGSPSASSGALGGAPLGSAPLGGGTYPPQTVPPLYIGSDNLALRIRTREAGPRHERHGIIIGQRKWAKIGCWHVVHRGLPYWQVVMLSMFADAGTFNLLPTGDAMDLVYVVRWIDRHFDPKQERGGLYQIEYDLEELP